VWRLAPQRGVDKSALEHVVHKVFAVVHGRLISLERSSELRISIASVTRHVVRSYLRQLGENSELEPEPGNARLGPFDLGPIEALEKKSAAELVDIILNEMSEPEREVFILCDLEGFSLSETAQALHVTENTLSLRLMEARGVFNAVSAQLRAQRFFRARTAGDQP
jgi:RNA polymerase sigma-70 factor (ECF subfamily)